MEITHTANQNQGSFKVATAQEVVGELTYSLVEETSAINLDHTWIDPIHRGQGIGDQLVLKAIDYARENQLKIKPSCPFVIRFFEKHPEYSDLLV
jgi:predicted GNAT family acetyltransferase